MLPHQKIIYPCPFCDQETLEVLWWPGHKAAKRSQSAAAGSKTTFHKEDEGLVLLSEKCSNCGKTKKEIEGRWKGEQKKEVDLKKRIEELEKLGFSTSIKG
jgi:sarcosine oxidase delta subunit